MPDYACGDGRGITASPSGFLSPAAWVGPTVSWTSQAGIPAGSDSSQFYQLVGLSESWGLCLDAYNWGYTDGTVVQLFNCHNNAYLTVSACPNPSPNCAWDSQMFKYVAVAGSSGSYSFVQRKALRVDGVNRCVTAASTAAGAVLTLEKCGAAAAAAGDPATPLATQIFQFTP